MATNSKILLYGLGKTNRALFDKLKFHDHLFVGSDYESDLLHVDKKYHWDSDLVSLDDFDVVYVPPGIFQITKFMSIRMFVMNLILVYLSLLRELKSLVLPVLMVKLHCVSYCMIFSLRGIRTALVGNIGVPGSTVIAQDWDFVIVELSSFQLFSMKEKVLDQALITGFEIDHLIGTLTWSITGRVFTHELLRGGFLWVPLHLEVDSDKSRTYSLTYLKQISRMNG